jgi:cytochrome P450
VDKLVAAVVQSGTFKGDSGEEVVLAKELAKDCKDPIQLRNHLLHVLQAGRDTSASLISNTVFELARRPAVWKKLKEEVAKLEGRNPTYEELKGMKHLKNCLQECECFRFIDILAHALRSPSSLSTNSDKCAICEQAHYFATRGRNER